MSQLGAIKMGPPMMYAKVLIEEVLLGKKGLVAKFVKRFRGISWFSLRTDF
jgi:hypothetical protein